MHLTRPGVAGARRVRAGLDVCKGSRRLCGVSVAKEIPTQPPHSLSCVDVVAVCYGQKRVALFRSGILVKLPKADSTEFSPASIAAAFGCTSSRTYREGLKVVKVTRVVTTVSPPRPDCQFTYISSLTSSAVEWIFIFPSLVKHDHRRDQRGRYQQTQHRHTCQGSINASRGGKAVVHQRLGYSRNGYFLKIEQVSRDCCVRQEGSGRR